MRKKHLDTDFSTLQAYVRSLFNAQPNNLQRMVTSEEQLQELESLKQTLGGERFFFIINVPDFEILQTVGINKWLGYSDNQFSLYDYWENVVHPQSKNSLLLIAYQLYTSLCSGKYPLQFMVQRYSTKIALRHRDGHYILAKKTSSIFQYDIKNRLLGYLNEFTIIGDYNGEPIEPKMYNSQGYRETEKEKEILEETMKKFLKMRVFSVKELQTARLLAYQPDITKEIIAKKFAVTKNTVDTFYKRFLAKSREFFGQEFESARDAAVFLKREGLL
jgi:hypothetical protein